MSELFDMWNAMKRSSYTRVIDELEESVAAFDDDSDELIKLCLEKVSTILHVEASSFWLHHLSGDGLIRPHAFNGGGDLTGVKLFPNEGIVGKVISTGEAIIIEDCQKDANFASKVDNKTGFITKTMICVPTISRGSTFGCIQLINKKDDTLFDEQDLELATNLSNKVVEILEKKNVIEEYGYGNVDPLKLKNRGGEISDVASMFVDLVGFEELAENVDEKTFASVVHAFVSYVSNIVGDHHGNYDKLMNQRIQSFWGGHKEVDNPAYDACLAAKDILDNSAELITTVKTRYGVDISLNIAIGYGKSYLGNIGSKQSLDYTVVGNCVIEASIIMDECDKNQIVITKDVFEQVSRSAYINASKLKSAKFGNRSMVEAYLLKEVE